MPELSIIIICYKVETYLSQCIESILNQTYTEYELILVDDGSPDQCGHICDEYARKDCRIKVIHQKNQGPVMARWNGQKAARGKYIAFLDGDDWSEKDMFSRMMRLAEQHQADMVITGYQEDMAGDCILKNTAIPSGTYREEKLKEIQSKAIYTGTFYEAGINGALWNKLIKKELLEKNYHHADSDVRMGDDATITYPMIIRAETIVIDNDFYPYHYRILSSSMSRRFDADYFYRARLLLDSIRNNLENRFDVLDAFQYYCLFIARICVSQAWIHFGSFSILHRTEAVKQAAHMIKPYVNKKQIDWQGFSPEDEREMKCLINGQINRFVFSRYLQGLKSKLHRHSDNQGRGI